MADKRDFYEVLGVDKSADADAIKRAYRQLAKKYHPDMNPGDKTAEAKFKEVNEAYEILSDPEKKSRYDQFGHAGVDPNFGAGGGYGGSGFGGGFGGFGDIFDSFFGGGFGGGGFGGQAQSGRRAAVKGEDVYANVTITFEEAAFGVDKEIEVQRIEQCAACDGTGAAEGSEPETCSNCHGTGQVRVSRNTFGMVMQTVQACPVCGGTGKIIKNPCPKCRGKGRVRARHKLTVRIPAGIDDGQSIFVRGQGDAGERGGGAGDVVISVNVRPHAIFERDGNDVHCEIPITYAQAALGAELEVPTLYGRVSYNIPEGTQTGTVFRLRGKGITRVNTQSKGDQYVHVAVEVPKNLSSKQKDLLREFDSLAGRGQNARSKSFFDKVKDAFK